MLPDASDVAAFLGRSGDAATVDLATQHLPVVTAMVKAYVRSNGFDELGEPADDLALIIISSCARLVENPSGLREESSGIDDATFTKRYAVLDGWTLPELAVLHRYRKRAL